MNPIIFVVLPSDCVFPAFIRVDPLRFRLLTTAAARVNRTIPWKVCLLLPSTEWLQDGNLWCPWPGVGSLVSCPHKPPWMSDQSVVSEGFRCLSHTEGVKAGYRLRSSVWLFLQKETMLFVVPVLLCCVDAHPGDGIFDIFIRILPVFFVFSEFFLYFFLCFPSCELIHVHFLRCYIRWWYLTHLHH